MLDNLLRRHPIAENDNIDAQQAAETLDDDAKAQPMGNELDITALQATTSAHDDWLPFAHVLVQDIS